MGCTANSNVNSTIKINKKEGSITAAQRQSLDDNFPGAMRGRKLEELTF